MADYHKIQEALEASNYAIAAKELGMIKSGVAPVEVEIISMPENRKANKT